jgi:hypothetical protein
MLHYYLKDGKREKGPFVIDDLKYQRIQPETLVKIDDGQWRPVSEVPDLAFLLRLDDHKHGTASFAKPDHHVHQGDPAQQARKRATIAIGIAILLAAMGLAGAMFFLNAPAR